MKRIIISFLVLLLSVWLGIIIHRDTGYVLISYHGWSLETSLWFSIAILMVLFLLFYILLRLSGNVKSATTHIEQWLRNRHKNKARIQTTLGLYDFAEGNWKLSEKKLLRAAKHSDMPLINYLAAAFMAQQQEAFDRRDAYLLLAQKTNKDRPIAVGLTQARLQIFNKQWEEALATLQHLHKSQPKNAFILQLLKQVYLELKDWSGLKTILPLLRKYRAINREDINQLELKIYSELLLASIPKNIIENEWSELPSYLQKQPALVAIYAEYLLDNNKAEEAESLLKIIVRKNLDERLLELYAKTPSKNPMKKTARTEKWLKANPENAALLLCLGRICKQQKLWGQARKYFERSAHLTPTAIAYSELGKILEMENDLSGALLYYDKGLEKIINKKD